MHALGGLAQAVEVVAGDHDFERRREREQARAAELVLHAGHLLQRVAQLRDRALFVLARRAVTERDADAAGVLAGIDRVRVEAVAGAGDGVGEGEVRQLLARIWTRETAWSVCSSGVPGASRRSTLNSPCEICGISSLPSRGTSSIVTQEQRERAAEHLDSMLERPAKRRQVESLAEQVERLRCVHGGAEQPLHRARDRSRSAPQRGDCRRQRARRLGRAACAAAPAASVGLCGVAARREHRHQRQRDDQREQQREASPSAPGPGTAGRRCR